MHRGNGDGIKADWVQTNACYGRICGTLVICRSDTGGRRCSLKTKDLLARRVGMTSVSVTARFGLRRMRRDCAHSVSLPDPFPDTKRLELHEVQPPAAARAREICR